MTSWAGISPAAVCLGAALLPLLAGAAQAQSADLPVLRPVDTTGIADRSQGFTEPSGLALASDGDGYWSVSDDTARIFRLTPDGRVIPQRSIPLARKDLEGVVEDGARSRVLAVQEGGAEIIEIGLGDLSVRAHPLADMAGFDGISDLFGPLGSNNGLEGISVDTRSGEVVVIKEDGPRLLLRLSADLSTVLAAVPLTQDRGFACDGTDDADLDASDLTFDPQRQAFWILSDTGACLFLFDPLTERAQGLSIPGPADHPDKRLKNPEGIALNRDGTELRIVTDNGGSSRLVVLSVE
jgi:uncharacterized protein YjiK